MVSSPPVGPVAQGLERAAHNRLVVGSIPTGPTRPPYNLNFSDCATYPAKDALRSKEFGRWRDANFLESERIRNRLKQVSAPFCKIDSAEFF